MLLFVFFQAATGHPDSLPAMAAKNQLLFLIKCTDFQSLHSNLLFHSRNHGALGRGGVREENLSISSGESLSISQEKGRKLFCILTTARSTQPSTQYRKTVNTSWQPLKTRNITEYLIQQHCGEIQADSVKSHGNNQVTVSFLVNILCI